jgi:threonine aldolase
MLDAMFHAEVGDDVYKEDPVNELERRVAEMFGMDDALFLRVWQIKPRSRCIQPGEQIDLW